MRKIMILAVTLIAAGSMGTISAQAFNKTNGVGFALTDDDGCVIWDDPNTMTAPAVEVASTTTTGRLTLKPVPATVTSVVETTTTIAIVNAPETAPTFAGVTTEDSTTETTTSTTETTTTVSTETTTETTTSATTSAETSAETSTETTVTTTAETVMVKASDGETEITVVTTWDKIKAFVKSLFS